MKTNTKTPAPEQAAEPWYVEYFYVSSGTGQVSTATIKLKHGGTTVQDAGIGTNSISATVNAINRLTKTHGRLVGCSPRFTLPDRDGNMLFEASARVIFDGKRLFTGRDSGTGIVDAIAKAYVAAVSEYLADRGSKKRRGKATAY